MTGLMDVRITGALVLLLIGTAIAGLLGGVAALSVAGCVWGVVLLLTVTRRFKDGAVPRQAVGLCRLFAAANAVWLVSDVLRASGAVGSTAGYPSAADLTALAGTGMFCVVIAWVGKLRGPWPDPTRPLEALVFVASLSAPLWFSVIEPQGAPTPLVVWGLTTLVFLGFGTTYIMGGGIWNVPAVLLALGVIGNVGIDVAVHVAQQKGLIAQATPVWPHFGFGFVLWTFVAVHPRFTEVFSSSRASSGIPLEARVWMLAPCVGLPLGVLAWSYVTGDPLPIGLVVGSLAVVTTAIAGLAVIEWRRGSETWHVSLTISFTTLIAALAAVCLSLAGTSTERAQARADRLSAVIPSIDRLDAALLRATAPGAASTDAVQLEWTRAVAAARAAVGRADHRLQQLLASYVAAGDARVASRAMGGAAVDAGPSPRYDQLIGRIRSDVVRERATGLHHAKRARLAMVLALLSALVAITILLMRFSFAGRRAVATYLELHDALTNLPNRAAIEHRLRRSSELSSAAEGPTLVLLDLDDFKSLNDVHGHPVGDELLRGVALRLTAATRPDEFLARVDGDAFAILAEGVADAPAIARRMTAVLARPFEIDGTEHTVEGSIGVATGSEAQDADATDDERALVVLRNAELAMYEAKHRAGTSVVAFLPSMHEAARDRAALTVDLRHALENAGLHLVYQPIVDLQSGRARGYEALARWDHPTRGPLAPADFIPLAEATGLVVDLGGWALREACRQLRSWQAGWPDRRYVSVNVAGQQLAAGVFPAQVRAALDASGLPPEQLLIEVTESSLIENVDSAMDQMAAVRALGVRFALDDFGTGYSSLSYLRQFRVDIVKVDKSFIDDIIDVDGTSLVEAIVHMATSLRMKVVAEGIESGPQADVLRRLGCELGQGFRFSRPLAVGDVMRAPEVLGEAPTNGLRVTGPGESRVA